MSTKPKKADQGEGAKPVPIGEHDEELYSIKKLARLTGEHPQTWRDRIARGDIAAIDICKAGALRATPRIRQRVLEAWVNARPKIKAKMKTKTAAAVAT